MAYSVTDRNAWYALHVRTNREVTVAEKLTEKGYEVYVPLMGEKRTYSGRIREYQIPCFRGYLFCRLDIENSLPVLTSPDVYRFLGTAGKAEVVPDREIDAIRLIVESGLSIERAPFPSIGDLVQIASGPLCGLEGVLIKLKTGYRAVVSVTLLRRSVSVELETMNIMAREETISCNA